MANEKSSTKSPRAKAIELPDPPRADQEIVAENIRALQAAYFAAMFEELGVFGVVDRLVELFQTGQLPLGSSKAGRSLFKYWKDAQSRISERERRKFYAQAFGLPGADAVGVTPNREFNDLWLRFVSAVASLTAKRGTSAGGALNIVSHDEVRTAARELAANLSLHGYGWANFMATELRQQINDVTRILSDKEIQSAYGARDMWQAIEQVAARELGGPQDVVRYRTMATAGDAIIAWLAKNARKLSSASTAPILRPTAFQKSGIRQAASIPSSNPTDSDLVNACEQWLAVNSIPENSMALNSRL